MTVPRERTVREQGQGAGVPEAPVVERPRFNRRIGDKPVVRAGVVAWSIVGLLLVAAVMLFLLSKLTVVLVPLTLAAFAAAVLVAPASALKARGVPDGLAALLVVLGTVALLAAIFGTLAPAVADQLGGLVDQVEAGYTEVRDYLAAGPLQVQTLPLDQLLEQLRERAGEDGGELGSRIFEAGILVVEGVAGLALGLLTLFFYLKDGDRLSGWARDLFPMRMRNDVQSIGNLVWFTIGAYIRGLLIIGFVDAVAIGTGLFALGIPLALPLAVLVFFGALFPIVGAFLAGTVAVLVALATNGPGSALAVLILIVVVQQVEGHVLTPVLLGRATELHPLGIIVALAAGGVLMGVLGAFLAVPLVASFARALSYIRTRTPADPEPV